MNTAYLPRTFLLAIILALSVAVSVRAQEAVVNGGFETGTFSSWTVVDPSGFTNIGPDPLFAHSGTYHANLGAEGVIGTLSQTLNTTPGTTYDVSFWLTNDSGAMTNSFQVFWNGASILSLTNAPVSNYTEYTFTLMATSATTPLEFDYRNDDDFFRLDDVSAVGQVPEPSVIALAAVGLMGLVLVSRRRALQ